MSDRTHEVDKFLTVASVTVQTLRAKIRCLIIDNPCPGPGLSKSIAETKH